MSAPTPYTSSPTTNFFVNSGLSNVDPFLSGVKWGVSGVGTTATIYYSFPVFSSTTLWDQGLNAYQFGQGYEVDTGFIPLNFIQKIYATVALEAWANVANISIIKVATETSSAVGDIRVAFTSGGLMQPNDFAYAYTPGPSYGGDVWLNTVQPVATGNDSNVGGFGFQTLVHALGLAHPFEGSAPLSTTLDNFKYTQMSYSDAPGHQDGGRSSYYPSTPMLLDIQAIQYLYGANMSYNAGNDTYTYSGAGKYYETIWDAGGIDTIIYDATTSGIINLNAGAFSALGSPVFLDNGRLQRDDVAIAYNVIIENATGGTGNDSIYGNLADNTLNGNAGDDFLIGGAGNDTLIGGDGNDKLDGGDGNDVYVIDVTTDVISFDSSGIDTVNLYYTTGTYTLAADLEHINLLGTAAINGTGNALNNIITGNTAANLLFGGNGNDTLNGGAGNDTLGGGAGNDVLNGGEAADLYLVADATYKLQAEINDTGLLGIDELRFNSGLAGTTLTVHAGDTGLERVVVGTGLAAAADITGTVALNVNASAALNALSITGNAGANSITGGAGNDLLFGNAGNDTLIGGDGNDTLRSGLGSDVLDGGNGDDAYFIDLGTDVILADSSGIDTVNLFYTTGTYTLAADLEHINLLGTAAINGTGNALNNIITGNDAANGITGGAGNDLLFGNAGNDTLIGGDGNDTLSGGLGQDVFDFNAVMESLVGAPRDIITDFSHAQLDKIDLSTIDANSILLNDQAFLSTVLTSGAFTSAGQLRLVGNVLSGNTNNDFTTSEFEIQLTGIDTLISADFIL